MVDVTTVLFRNNHKGYYFKAIDGLKEGDKVVVETTKGKELATVVNPIKSVEEKDIIGELKPILRVASEADLSNFEENLKLVPSIIETVKEKVREENLEMKVLNAEYTLDKSKLIIYFTADDRIDFRELVKTLAYIYKTRIELRQIGPRDASKIVGGLGICGHELCCKSFLGDIQNVTIKMAKNQNLSLNPNTISGLCGKLLCCISYEDSFYQSVRDRMPNIGDIIETEKGNAEVISVSILDETITVKHLDNSQEVISLNDIKED